ncbi:MAG: peroxiredoxin [Piscirickettsiaceae bacterium CG_4_9_14_3_um_filter_43_564]|nr:OsmC family protein [Thiomicrospira sp.]OIP93710.1 MAG: peroxiredoxin [Thiomicrospira sp. CG2_30_44_34]PIQ02687.1 MAG: peroxiredoxin [Piscirickettsiaceae bacterium CG18_big_fil_WC_8_21_14_2_50_44_103]PIU38865.1 MAG: peroxiredoxin [Piscirickettsiaceae bacterium CG07_land_8_20_14_0_80_44_28]PIW78000.1 MAG: peroxiredoxin [Piscirickettsiaceae bacterium CG_4_8_14_3_um_filter_44_38]PIX79202.1 MAG: peroxiredoxin [Piscirickettsiaceae bacterium CG_4_10_14_3_um_filter_44_349]PIY76981.1 MAG: peroxire
MTINIKWQGGMAFEGTTESGHSVLMDAAPEVGGENKGARPMEMVLLGLGGCTSIDVIMMLQKAKQAVEDCQVEIRSERSDSIPKVFTKIHVHFKITGQDLNPKKVERAVNLSAEKYCSVSKMLEASVEMSHDFEIITP